MTPLTSAALRSSVCEMSATLSVSTVEGPPCAWTPVYSDLSSWNLLASAFVPVKTGPPLASTEATSVAYSSLRFSAHNLRPSWNCLKFILRAALSLTFEKMRSMSVVVHALFRTPQSFANLAKVLPSISFSSLLKFAKTASRLSAAAAYSTLGLVALGFVDAFFSSSTMTPATLCTSAVPVVVSFLTPLTSAALRSSVCEISTTLSVSTVEGPPYAWTPV